MKKLLCLTAGLLALNLTPAFGQPTPATPVAQPRPMPPPGATVFQERLQSIIRNADGSPQASVPALTKFNLDFPGGTPKELVMAIEKAMGKPLNVIIADEDANTQLPPIKGSDLDVAKLFQTLSEIGAKYAYDENGNRGNLISNYGFMTRGQSPADNSLWTFYAYTKKTLQTQFSLDFPGGSPVQLVKAIEKAMGKPLNVIINQEDAGVELPPLKMNEVYLPQLFNALGQVSSKSVSVRRDLNRYETWNIGCEFKTTDNQSDSSVWFFRVLKPTVSPVEPPNKINQFYSLSPYLDRGFTVDDITTAIQTGWKMAGVTPTPELNYHKETKLLIAFGEPGQLKTIDDVLKTLPASNVTPLTAKEYEKGWQEIAANWQEMHNKYGALDFKIKQLEEKITKLTSATNSAPVEKSGK